MSFPKNFLWGGSISAAQAEGGWNEGGKSPVQIDFGDAGSPAGPRRIHYRNADGSRGVMLQFDHLPEGARYELFDDVHYTNHVGSDFYHRYKEDIALYAELGLKSFNTTISWARIYPYGIQGGVNREGVEFYRNVFKELRKYGIEPKRMRLVYPYVDKEPNMVLVEGVRGGGAQLTVEAPLIVYENPGEYTKEIYEIYGMN